jgi:hypothetical protein
LGFVRFFLLVVTNGFEKRFLNESSVSRLAG